MGSFANKVLSIGATLGAVVAALIVTAPSAYAVPGFARQTGLACEACHTIFPELTPFGRQFKLNAYVFSNTPKVSDINEKRETTLSIGAIPPFSMQAQASFTSLGHSIPDSGNGKVFADGSTLSDLAQKNSAQVPQALSLFYTGEIADNFGAFIQLTWDPSGNSVGIDNTEFRFSDAANLFSRNVVYGLSLNNNPTSQDVWNSTPAWGFPFLTSNVVPTPAASALLDANNLGGQAAGATGYLWIDNHLYLELGGYRSAHTGDFGGIPADSTTEQNINGTALYWRLGWEQNWERNSLFVGTYGLNGKTNEGGVGFHGPSNNVTDYAFDAQYQWIGEDHIASGTWTYIHEDKSVGNVSDLLGTPLTNSSNHLDTFRLTGNYYYKRRYGGSLQYFQTTGSTDLGLFTPSPVTGSRNGNPFSNGFVFELNYLPWLNTKISAQYIAYLKFNGNSTDYDGSGRNASANNTFFLSLWTAF